ncbi:esterase-like activity of phytase family protein [Dyadobacter sp. CY261]|uniref:esterase-like activity of phytase family protein n=1 Tax=Dyadobacter sp. CY261 TaxID=2907203 RepID=UPI001F2D361E|nr:esterase-like activity of phytase family protein [Dyadobacter sp. CY261]MCF0069119.1 esterase-like activity of phytase family protein [Dyadobacter sp. CY261]
MKPFLLSLISTAAAVAVLNSCTDHGLPSDSYPARAEAQNPKIITEVGNVKVYNGGFGSALVQDPNDHMAFYLLTDRGSNIDGKVADSKVFADPSFAPQIGRFRLQGDQLILDKIIELKNEKGEKLNGLPNPPGFGYSGELALDVLNNTLPNNIDGLDSEGMALAKDGTFWVSDEYGPHLVHFDKDGNTLERINPFGNGFGNRRIPLVFAKRRPNRGMEGLTITPDGKTLVGIMQFPLYNPSAADISGSLVTRILVFDIVTGVSKEYVYLIDRANLQANSEIVAVDNTTFLVLERDGEYATDANRATVIKKVYKVDIGNATDITDPANGVNGKLFGGLTVEQLKTAANLTANGIKPVTKTLVADLMTDIPTLYPHDKAEGIAIINSTTIAISNDDDFGVVGSGGIYTQKILQGTGLVDRNTIYFVKLKQPLW